MILRPGCLLLGALVLCSCQRAEKISGDQMGPRVSIDSLEPNPATTGATVAIVFHADVALTSCNASVGGQAAACDDPAGMNCTCHLDVTAAAPPEGSATVVAVAVAADGSGEARGELVVDRSPPVLAPSRMSIGRFPAGQDDTVSATAGAVQDAWTRVESLEFWASPERDDLLLELAPEEDGSLPPASIPDSSGAPGALSPPRLWVSAVDQVGNRSPRSEIANGRDDQGPVFDPEHAFITRYDLTRADTVTGQTGAVEAHGCQPLEVRLYQRADGMDPIVTAAPGADGAFGPIEIGTPDQAPARVWAAGVDKCGLEGGRVEITDGANLSGPGLALDRVTWHRREWGTADGLAGEAGAVTPEACWPTEVHACDGIDGEPIGTATIADDGSFAEITIGTGSASASRIWVEAEDKCNTVSGRTEVVSGSDTEPPVIDEDRVVFHLCDTGNPDGVSGLAGAVADNASAVVVQLFDDPAAGNILLGGIVPEPDGGFARENIGDTGLGIIWLLARDKAGNQATGRVRSGRIEETRTLAGRTPHADGLDRNLAMYAMAADHVPRTLGPGLASVLAGEVPAADAEAAAMVDANRASVAALPAQQSIAPEWLAVTTQTTPPARDKHAMVYDAARGVIVMFGGRCGSDCALDDTWEYDGTDWTAITTQHVPPARYLHGMAWDATRGETLVFGGRCGTSCRLGDTWAYDGTDWRVLEPLHAPSPRGGSSMAYDAARGTIVVFGGFGCVDESSLETSCFRNDTWSWNGTDWTAAPDDPGLDTSAYHVMSFDPGHNRTVRFGGYGLADPGGQEWRGLLFWEKTAWYESDPPPVDVQNRAGHALVYHPASDALLLYGGAGAPGDTWLFDGTSWVVAESDSAPAAEDDLAMAVDPSSSRVVLFGGHAGSQANILGETWEFVQTTPHVRWAAQVATTLVQVPAGLVSLGTTWVGAGSGDHAGSATPGLELLAWNWASGSWESLGTHQSLDSDPAAQRTIAAELASSPGDFVQEGRVWIMAAAAHPSAASPSGPASEVHTDYVEIRVTYLLPD